MSSMVLAEQARLSVCCLLLAATTFRGQAFQLGQEEQGQVPFEPVEGQRGGGVAITQHASV